MDPVLEKILAMHQGGRCGNYVMKSESEQPAKVEPAVSQNRVISLSAKTLPQVKAGMYWYDDNTVSTKLDTDRSLKSVVLFVKDNVVYGDTFEQRYMLGKKISTYMSETSAKLIRPLHRPKTDELISVYDVRETINKSLKSLKKLPWSEELYWADVLSPDDSRLVDLFDASELSMSNEKGAYFRPMITLQVK